jgi:alkylhydroperoxidase family enzyme
MSWIQMRDDDGSDAELAALFDEVRDPEAGEVDEIMRIHSLHPAGLEAHFRLYAAVMRPSAGLKKVDRELIAFRVSQLNECHY